MKNLMERLNDIYTQIANSEYDGNVEDFLEIKNQARSFWDLVMYVFRYGYMQGHKAAIAEMQRKARAKQ